MLQKQDSRSKSKVSWIALLAMCGEVPTRMSRYLTRKRRSGPRVSIAAEWFSTSHDDQVCWFPARRLSTWLVAVVVGILMLSSCATLKTLISPGGPLDRTDLKATLESFSDTQNRDGRELYTPLDLADALSKMRFEVGSQQNVHK